MDRLSEAQVSATIREDATNEVISHDSPTACIMLPMFDTIAASQMALNALYFKGDNPDEEELLLLPLLPLFLMRICSTTDSTNLYYILQSHPVRSVLCEKKAIMK
jgi:hypothetical protein